MKYSGFSILLAEEVLIARGALLGRVLLAEFGPLFSKLAEKGFLFVCLSRGKRPFFLPVAEISVRLNNSLTFLFLLV